MKAIELAKEKISWKTTGSAIFLVFNSFVWYILTFSVFSEIVNGLEEPESKIVLYSIYFAIVAISAIIGAKIFPRFRFKALIVWTFFGAISTVLLFFISSGDFLISGIVAGLFGLSVGVGFPSCLSYFAGFTKIENRGFAGGVILSLVGVFVLGLAFLFAGFNEQLWILIILLTFWRFFGGLIFKVLNKEEEVPEVQEAPSYLELIMDRKILLYLFP
jgi:MFS family permease